jgi:hypothetical protein
MLAKGIRRDTVVVAVWWLGVAISAITFFAHLHRPDEADFSLRSPFDNTRSGHAEQWIFLSEAARHVPPGASFTVLAEDPETEMSLFMISVGLLPEASPLPSSYYGRPTSAGDRARFVLVSDGSRTVQAPHDSAIEISGGRVTYRSASDP